MCFISPKLLSDYNYTKIFIYYRELIDYNINFRQRQVSVFSEYSDLLCIRSLFALSIEIDD